MALNIHIDRLQKLYPEEPKGIIQLACFLHDNIAKAKEYAEELLCCNDYHDIAQKVVREMYVTCQVDKETAMKEKTFIRFLLDLSNYGIQGNTHTARHHINEMFKDKTVHEERKKTVQYLFNKRLKAVANEGVASDCVTVDISKMEEVTISFPLQYRGCSIPLIQALVDKGILVVKKSTSQSHTVLSSNKTTKYVIKGSRKEIVDSLKFIETKVNRNHVSAYTKSRPLFGAPRKRNALSMPGVRIDLSSICTQSASVKSIHISKGIALIAKGIY